MMIEIKKNTQDTVIQVVGRLDATTAPSLEKTVNEDIGDSKNLIIDLSGLEYISSAGLRVLLSMQKKIQQKGSLKVVNAGENIMEVFKITGFVDVLNIE